ncbi:MAG: NF038104 family lipoprotein [Pseudomonadota bacterium]
MRRYATAIALIVSPLALSGCLAASVAGNVVEGAVNITGDVAEGAVNTTGAVVGAAIPDGDKDDDKSEKDSD